MSDTQKLADIVVGVDGSDESFAALNWALRESAATGQNVNAVYGWTHSWDMGERPENEAEWEKIHKLITMELNEWAERASRGIDFDRDRLTLTSVHAAGSTALLNIGKNSHQIIVGRRSLSRLARWFLGSMSDSLLDRAQVPVTIVHADTAEETAAEGSIAKALKPEGEGVGRSAGQEDSDEGSEISVTESEMLGSALMPIVAGVDGSAVSKRALAFAAEEAQATGRPLQVIYCWRINNLSEIADRTHAVPSHDEAQEYADKIVADIVSAARIPQSVRVNQHAFHISAVKGLQSASRYANRLIVGSRGLTGLDAVMLGSVSRQLLDSARCTVTIVH